MTVWPVVWAAAGVLLVIVGSGATPESSEPRGPVTPTPVEQASAQPLEDEENGQCSAEVHVWWGLMTMSSVGWG